MTEKSGCAVCNQVEHTSGFVPGVMAWNRNVKLESKWLAGMLMNRRMSGWRGGVKKVPLPLRGRPPMILRGNQNERDFREQTMEAVEEEQMGRAPPFLFNGADGPWVIGRGRGPGA